jgi:hypothetical protein
MIKNIRKLLTFVAFSIFLAGCLPAPTTTRALITTPVATPSLDALETGQANPTVEPESLPVVVEYNLGETTITQSMFPEDSRFRNMPIRLNGIIAAPEGEDGPYPVILILHGNHPGCPIPEGDMVDRWPCDPEVEQRNYPGFEYLVQRLAAQGYVALSININAEYTFGFGEPVPIERLGQLLDLHLEALAQPPAGDRTSLGWS